jgi:hypothetical protein
MRAPRTVENKFRDHTNAYYRTDPAKREVQDFLYKICLTQDMNYNQPLEPG